MMGPRLPVDTILDFTLGSSTGRVRARRGKDVRDYPPILFLKLMSSGFVNMAEYITTYRDYGLA